MSVKGSASHKRKVVPGVFCLEGEWSETLTDTRSVRPLLEVLQSNESIRLIHRCVNNLEDFENRLQQWRQKPQASYTLGYFGFHGSPGAVWIGGHKLTLEQLGERLQDQCRGKMLYFGSCSTLRVAPERVRQFRLQTGADCIMGYTKIVDWLPSSAFDLLLFEALTSYRRVHNVEAYLHRLHPAFVEQLGFQMHYK